MFYVLLTVAFPTHYRPYNFYECTAPRFTRDHPCVKGLPPARFAIFLSPSSTPKMPRTRRDIEHSLLAGINALKDQETPNFRTTALDFVVNERTLRRRWHSGKSLFQRPVNNRKLDTEQEKALYQSLNKLDSHDFNTLHRIIAPTANSILANGHCDPTEPASTIGPQWVKRFIQRHPEYCSNEGSSARNARHTTSRKYSKITGVMPLVMLIKSSQWCIKLSSSEDINGLRPK
jgi:hypothetical protein